MTCSGVISVRHFAQRLIAVVGDVFVDVLRVDHAAVTQRDALLLFIEIGVDSRLVTISSCTVSSIQKTLDDTALEQVLCHDFGHVLGLYHRCRKQPSG